MDELSKRNFHTLSEGLKEQRTVNTEQTVRIKKLEAEVVLLQQQINSINSRYWQDKAKAGVGMTANGSYN